MDIHKPDFWLRLHGQVPGLLNWPMDEELQLLVTTDQLPTDADPSLWMWVNPNIVCPITGSQGSGRPRARSLRPPSGPPPSGSLDCSEEEEEEEDELLLTSPSEWELSSADEENEEEEDTSSSPSPPPHRSQARLLQPARTRVGGVWPRPPLNYCHLITLALRNSPPCGLNVRQIYDFTGQHFPFFQTAPEGWKNTIRHNLCFRSSFEKSPCGAGGASSPSSPSRPRPRSCLWRLTAEGHRRFEEAARALTATRLNSIQRSMSQPAMMPSLFEL
ncbi:forkhead box protein R1 isoform X1 [Ornithorhynchus anatinus]|uniref:Forkhead box R1 n=1 Tax=Ornithorhynchus anatinus TaxID=9258 RepID=F7F9I4_ORNAN|nr:forkhead box protein R1 isoform X1 [Ornithorhynchus anatinus]